MDNEVKVLFRTPAPPKRSIATPLKGIIRQDIYLIHGFLNTKYSYYRDTLENWVKDSVKDSAPSQRDTTLTIRVFRFNTSLVPEIGKAVLENAVLKFRQHVLENLQQISADAEVSDMERGATSLRHDTPSDNDLGTNAILFIAHGLASWVVKDALAHPSSHGITYFYGKTGVDFVNLDIQNEHGTAYPDYLEKHWKNFWGYRTPHKGIVSMSWSPTSKKLTRTLRG
ncbi:hypothetical protein F4678DRAFT_239570 [Xylaria arbuscula]|nr:hypothetical protein F4678DRAFT_239570 [Xylaria arbuscula]